MGKGSRSHLSKSPGYDEQATLLECCISSGSNLFVCCPARVFPAKLDILLRVWNVENQGLLSDVSLYLTFLNISSGKDLQDCDYERDDASYLDFPISMSRT